MKIPSSAKETISRIQKGPKFSEMPGVPFTPEEANRAYQRWFSTWVKSDLERMFPELRKVK